MTPNYDTMTQTELRAYILSNRHDLDAIEVFFSRRSPDSEAVLLHPLKNEEERQQQLEMVRPVLERRPKDNDQL